MPPHISRPPGGREFVVPPLFNSALIFLSTSHLKHIGEKVIREEGGRFGLGHGKAICIYIMLLPPHSRQPGSQAASTAQSAHSWHREEIGTRCTRSKGRRGAPHIEEKGGIGTWLILPVVICLSQRLSHACVSINSFVL